MLGYHPHGTILHPYFRVETLVSQLLGGILSWVPPQEVSLDKERCPPKVMFPLRGSSHPVTRLYGLWSPHPSLNTGQCSHVISAPTVLTGWVEIFAANSLQFNFSLLQILLPSSLTPHERCSQEHYQQVSYTLISESGCILKELDLAQVDF